jgi:hypothetical protein
MPFRGQRVKNRKDSHPVDIYRVGFVKRVDQLIMIG